MPGINGTAMRVMVETTTPGSYVAVGGMQTLTYGGNTPSTSEPAFGEASETYLGAKERTMTLQGKFYASDAGQQRLRDVAATGAAVNIQVLRDGTNGYNVDVTVGGGDEEANAAGGPQRVTFNLAPVSAEAIEGTGPLPA